MPRGVPKNGTRRPRRTKAEMQMANFMQETTETDAEIDARISERFEILEYLATEAISGSVRAMIVSGPAGLGKSYTIEHVLREYDPNEVNHTIVKGYVKATGLLKLLWAHREKGQVLVMDDADTVFADETALNMIKAAADSGERRRISYLAEGTLVDEETAEIIPRQFDFEGTIVFITNLDFDSLIDKGHKFAPHLQALLSRAHYVDTTLKTKRDYIVRMRQVIRAGMLKDRGLSKSQEEEILNFIDKNAANLRELSLRMVLKLADLRMSKHGNWEKVARVTCCKN